jgi:hypothetical protein
VAKDSLEIVDDQQFDLKKFRGLGPWWIYKNLVGQSLESGLENDFGERIAVEMVVLERFETEYTTVHEIFDFEKTGAVVGSENGFDMYE